MFLYSKWLGLPLVKRAEIATKFGIAKVRSTHVSNDQVVDDGYNVKDIESALALDKLQAHFDTKEKDPHVLWVWLIDGTPVVEEPMGTVSATKITPEVVVKAVKKVVKKRGPAAKKNGK